MNSAEFFFDPASHGFVRVAVAGPRLRVADPEFNATETITLHAEAARQGASLVVFPELGLAAYTCDALFHQRPLLRAFEAALVRVVEASREHATAAVVGLPLILSPTGGGFRSRWPSPDHSTPSK